MPIDPDNDYGPAETGFDDFEELLEEVEDELEDLSPEDLEALKEEYDEEPN